MGIREIGRRLSLSRKAVRRIIQEEGEPIRVVRADRAAVDPERLRDLHAACRGYVQRMHECLGKEGLEIGYSTLTRLVRELKLDEAKDKRAEQHPDKPGKEMQHDTSPYVVELSGKPTPVVGSQLYLRYSKRRYLKFYPHFTRFRMKCFFHEALMHFRRSCGKCIIDNTNLAVLRGTGDDAVFVPEMIAFAEQYGFKWKAHAKGHPNRKGGVEKAFHFVETNFFPNRTFESFEDLNRQALEWATVEIPVKRHSKTRLIPAQLFEFEKPYLTEILPVLPAPYQEHERETDQYGYIAFDGNYYWVPGTGRGTVKVLQYDERIRLYKNREQLAEYRLPAHGSRNEKIRPAGVPMRGLTPKSCKRAVEAEERRLIAAGPSVADYLAAVRERRDAPVVWAKFVRRLFGLSLKLSAPLFVRTIERAAKYGVTDLEAIERIAVYLLRDDELGSMSESFADGDPDLENREAYRDGSVTEETDLERYDARMGVADEAAETDDDGGSDNGQGT